jgi:RimJ/RimL family protein N-acetyltransferase
MHKLELLQRLPVPCGEFTIRHITRDDIDRRAAWPAYPFPFTPFNSSWQILDSVRRDAVFADICRRNDALSVFADHPEQAGIAYLGLRAIDWQQRTAGNLVLRLHPQWCDRGVGTSLMQGLVAWSFAAGFTKLRHDVSAINLRAIRCYEKAGYRIVDEFWRDDTDFWRDIPENDPLRAQADGCLHVANERVNLKFYMMEVANH